MVDIFRRENRELSEGQKIAIETIKTQAIKLLEAIQYGRVLEDEVREAPAGSREMSCAVTKLEEAVMWATKHWTA